MEQEADDLAREWLSETRVARKGLSDERQSEYDRLEGMSTQPERISLTAPKVAQADRQAREKDGIERTLPTRRHHLMVAEDGTVPIDLNGWERKVLDSESKQAGFKGCYRNPSRATKESLAIAYRDAAGQWKALRPDFIFFSTAHDGTVVADVVDRTVTSRGRTPQVARTGRLRREVRPGVPPDRVGRRGRRHP